MSMYQSEWIKAAWHVRAAARRQRLEHFPSPSPIKMIKVALLPVPKPEPPAPVPTYEQNLADLMAILARDPKVSPLRSPTNHIKKIQSAVAQAFKCTMGDMVTQRRERRIARPRQIAMYLCKTLTPKSLVTIGKGFGNRDHTTVLHAVRQVETLCRRDPALAQKVEDIRAELEGR